MAEITIYTRRVCAFCDRAKALMKSLGLQYREINVDNDHDLFLRLSKEQGGWRTVPMIFIGNYFLGGFDEMSSLHKRGELLPLVDATSDTSSPGPSHSSGKD